MRPPLNHLLRILILSLASVTAHAAITVDEPAGNIVVAEGPNYPTETIGDRWDMEQSTDINLAETRALSSPSFGSGVYSATTVSNAVVMWMAYPGLPNAVRLDRGERFPIDTSKYYLFSVKIRIDDPSNRNQSAVVYSFPDAQAVVDSNFYLSAPIRVLTGDWRILTFDLRQPGGTSNMSWSDVASMHGFRFDPTNKPGVVVEVDWMRLHGESAAASVNVAWTGEAGVAKDVIAVDAQGAAAIIERDVMSPYQADLTRLPPGDYQLGVGDLTGTLEWVILSDFELSPGVVTVNAAPIAHLTEPDIRGDQSRGYAESILGNSWSILDAADVEETPDIVDLSFTGGVLQGRPVTSDPRILLNTPVDIDASTYRMLCYELEVAGERDIGKGSVARILWGDDRTDLVTSQDVVVEEGLNEYCLGDMAQIETEPTAPGNWLGEFRYLRLDPHEFPSSSPCPASGTPEQCRDIALGSVNLAPFDEISPEFLFSWTDSDPEDNASLEIFLDPDRIPDNANEISIVSGLSEDSATNSVLWDGATTATVPDGTYEVFIRADDGLNVIDRYATGPLIVGPRVTAEPALFRDGFEP